MLVVVPLSKHPRNPLCFRAFPETPPRPISSSRAVLCRQGGVRGACPKADSGPERPDLRPGRRKFCVRSSKNPFRKSGSLAHPRSTTCLGWLPKVRLFLLSFFVFFLFAWCLLVPQCYQRGCQASLPAIFVSVKMGGGHPKMGGVMSFWFRCKHQPKLVHNWEKPHFEQCRNQAAHAQLEVKSFRPANR